MKYEIKLAKSGRETSLGLWEAALPEAIEKAKAQLEWHAADSVRIVDETGREVWQEAAL